MRVNLQKLVDRVTDPNKHHYTLRDIEDDKVLGIYASMESAMLAGSTRKGHVTELVVWHPKTCDCEVDV